MKCPKCNGSGEIDDKTGGVGMLIQERRKAAGLTQYQLSELVGLSRTQITNIEVGRSDLTSNQVRKFAIALSCTPGDLFP